MWIHESYGDKKRRDALRRTIRLHTWLSLRVQFFVHAAILVRSHTQLPSGRAQSASLVAPPTKLPPAFGNRFTP